MLALLALAATGAAAAGSRASAPRPVPALEGGEPGVASTLVAVDPRTFDVVRRGAELPSWAFGFVSATSPDRRTIAVLPRPSDSADHLYLVDRRALRVRRVLPLGESACALAWPRAARLLALVAADCWDGSPLQLLEIDPAGPRVVSRRDAGAGAVRAAAAVPGGLVAVVSGPGAARLVVARGGRPRTVVLPWRLSGGEAVALAVDVGRGHVYVAAGDLQVVDFRLATGAVTLHRLRGVRAPAMTEKGAVGPVPSLTVPAAGRLAAAVGEFRRDESFRPSGAWLVDTRTWRRRLLTRDAGKVAAGGGALVAYGGGSGAELFTAAGRFRRRLLPGLRVDSARIVEGMVLLDSTGLPVGIRLADGRRTFFGGPDELLYSLLTP
jgi:hypothetical protein